MRADDIDGPDAKRVKHAAMCGGVVGDLDRMRRRVGFAIAGRVACHRAAVAAHLCK